MNQKDTKIDYKKVFRELPQIESQRMTLRKLSLRDAGSMFEYASDPEVTRFVTWEQHRTVADSIHFLRRVKMQSKRGEPSPWGIVLKESGMLAGTIGYHCLNAEHGCAEVGFTLSRNYWNKGLMTEALSYVIRFGFEKLNLNRIEARCKVDNFASERVMKKCGMKLEGIMREQMFVKGEYHDLKMYSVLKKEYDG